MTLAREFVLILPNQPVDGSSPAQVHGRGPVVVIGANGSGKTRLGAWIELKSPQMAKCHRISAQKSLDLPKFVSPLAMTAAEDDLLYGYSQAQGNPSFKIGHRWSNNPNTVLLNDYQKLLVYLFSDHYEVSTKYMEQMRNATGRIDPPTTKLDVVRSIWEATLQDKQLEFGGGVVQVRTRGSSEPLYNASDLSDGERVVFYLIGQCLSAPTDGVVVIDEPELHLHRSLQSRLWDRIEAQRSDCLFVYLTHDVDFAASRVGATRIWLQGMRGEAWLWSSVPDNEPIPDDVLLSILGTRQPVLFVEGDRNSLDQFLFSHVYDQFTVTPCGSAPDVIHATGAFTKLNYLHGLKCHGLIDRDYRSDADLVGLAGTGVTTLDYAELENVLLSEPIVRVVARTLVRPEDDTVKLVQAAVFQQLDAPMSKAVLASAIVRDRVEAQLARVSMSVRGKDMLRQAYGEITSAIDTDSLYDATIARIDAIIAARDYAGALRIYKNKGLVYVVAPALGMLGAEYRALIARLLGSEHAPTIKAALRTAVPDISL